MCSELDSVPGGWVLGIWVEVGWVGELTVVVLGVESSDGGLTNNVELINVLLVGEVLVKVVLQVLEQVHVLLDEVVSSDSLEGECLVEELVRLYSHLWVFALSLHLSVDVHGVGVVLLVEVSGEVVQLLLEGLIIDLEWLSNAWSLGSWEGGLLELDSGDGAESGNNKGIFHCN